MNIEKAIEFAESIDLEILFSKIRKITSMPDLKFTHQVKERNNGVRITFNSQDLIDKVGFLKLMFKSIEITNFNSNIIWKSDIDEDYNEQYESEDIHNQNMESNGYFLFWGTVSFSYEHPSGGSNGYQFLTFWYDERHGWQFE